MLEEHILLSILMTFTCNSYSAFSWCWSLDIDPDYDMCELEANRWSFETILLETLLFHVMLQALVLAVWTVWAVWLSCTYYVTVTNCTFCSYCQYERFEAWYERTLKSGFSIGKKKCLVHDVMTTHRITSVRDQTRKFKILKDMNAA